MLYHYALPYSSAPTDKIRSYKLNCDGDEIELFFNTFTGSKILYKYQYSDPRRRRDVTRKRPRLLRHYFPATAAAVVTVQATGTPLIWRAR